MMKVHVLFLACVFSTAQAMQSAKSPDAAFLKIKGNASISSVSGTIVFNELIARMRQSEFATRVLPQLKTVACVKTTKSSVMWMIYHDEPSGARVATFANEANRVSEFEIHGLDNSADLEGQQERTSDIIPALSNYGDLINENSVIIALGFGLQKCDTRPRWVGTASWKAVQDNDETDVCRQLPRIVHNTWSEPWLSKFTNGKPTPAEANVVTSLDHAPPILTKHTSESAATKATTTMNVPDPIDESMSALGKTNAATNLDHAPPNVTKHTSETAATKTTTTLNVPDPADELIFAFNKVAAITSHGTNAFIEEMEEVSDVSGAVSNVTKTSWSATNDTAFYWYGNTAPHDLVSHFAGNKNSLSKKHATLIQFFREVLDMDATKLFEITKSESGQAMPWKNWFITSPDVLLYLAKLHALLYSWIDTKYPVKTIGCSPDYFNIPGAYFWGALDGAALRCWGYIGEYVTMMYLTSDTELFQIDCDKIDPFHKNHSKSLSQRIDIAWKALNA